MFEGTTIQIQKKTRDKLVEIGKKNETYDDIIINLINLYEDRPESNQTQRRYRIQDKAVKEMDE
jgi:hypothetical protein